MTSAMSALLGIGWAALLLLAIWLIYATFGNYGLTSMFPEGRRWWHPWARFGALLVFAVVTLINPFR